MPFSFPWHSQSLYKCSQSLSIEKKKVLLINRKRGKEVDEGAKVIQKKKKKKKKQYHNGTLYVPVNTKTVGSHNEMGLSMHAECTNKATG